MRAIAGRLQYSISIHFICMWFRFYCLQFSWNLVVWKRCVWHESPSIQFSYIVRLTKWYLVRACMCLSLLLLLLLPLPPSISLPLPLLLCLCLCLCFCFCLCAQRFCVWLFLSLSVLCCCIALNRVYTHNEHWYLPSFRVCSIPLSASLYNIFYNTTHAIFNHTVNSNGSLLKYTHRHCV